MKLIGTAFLLWVLLSASGASKGHNRPNTEHNRRHAITYAFCKSLKPCPLGNEALNVAYCESGPNLWPWARNGDHLGLFQVDSLWRSQIPGWSWSPWAQARHAYRIWLRTGWRPWDCG